MTNWIVQHGFNMVENSFIVSMFLITALLISSFVRITYFADKIANLIGKFSNRRLKKLIFLRDITAENKQSHKFILTAIDETIFQEIFGRSFTQNKAKAYAELYSKGVFTTLELRRANPYIKIDDNQKPQIILKWYDEFALQLWRIVILSILFMSILMFFFFITNDDIYKAIVVISVFLPLSMLGILITGEDQINTITAKRVRKKLEKLYPSETSASEHSPRRSD
ncbi:MAG: hypothetical protein LBV61_02715 [Burkholderiaceae bacterium]|jgi:hypothetical protein|nr:hypothetical protein [Burkholderiaceae bacterium]